MLHGERDLKSESHTPQLMISVNTLSGAWRSERLREHARGEPTRSSRGRARGSGGGEGRLASGRRAPCVEPKRRATTGVAASRRTSLSMVAVESSAEAAGWDRRRQQQRRAAEAGRSRKASRVLDEERVEEGDTR